MNNLNEGLGILLDSELIHVLGGVGGKGNPSEGQKLTGMAVAGALGGAVRGAPGGPAGVATGALVGASLGIGTHMVNSYATGGNRSNIPLTPQPGSGQMQMMPCHGPRMNMMSCHGQGKK